MTRNNGWEVLAEIVPSLWLWLTTYLRKNAGD
jgi:hypothetical protein